MEELSPRHHVAVQPWLIPVARPLHVQQLAGRAFAHRNSADTNATSSLRPEAPITIGRAIVSPPASVHVGRVLLYPAIDRHQSRQQRPPPFREFVLNPRRCFGKEVPQDETVSLQTAHVNVSIHWVMPSTWFFHAEKRRTLLDNSHNVTPLTMTLRQRVCHSGLRSSEEISSWKYLNQPCFLLSNDHRERLRSNERSRGLDRCRPDRKSARS